MVWELAEKPTGGELDWTEGMADGTFAPAKGMVGPTKCGKGSKIMLPLMGTEHR
ncbi:MAG: hypothetical protein R3C11_27755 [Planctomycetaceae bacterium]